ncbi:MAG: hypothetical protein JNL67_02140 [Planctomycetaceae bacterium]|nr:hypothetical protein [Planctomycetaceae bacterium]
MVRQQIWRGVISAIVCFAMVVGIPERCRAHESPRMGEETIGNKPLSDANFSQWDGIMPVVNHSTRVYHFWVNGNEQMFYKTTTTELNELIRNYAAMPMEGLEIVILPGPGKVTNFKRDQEFTYHCQLHVVAGIASVMHRRENGEVFWPKTPRLTLRIDDSIELDLLEFPQNCPVRWSNDLKQRFVKALDSKDQEVRGWGLSHLADLDPYDPELMEMVAAGLRDPEPWVGQCALGVLPKFGPAARKFLLPSSETDSNQSTGGDLSEDTAKAQLEFEKFDSDEVRRDFEQKRDIHSQLNERIRKRLGK